jgi:hypothetical protein
MASDRWITTRLRAELTFDTEINAVNYAIDTVAGTVFLSGIARDQAEIDRVVARAKRTSGVRDVVTAVRLRSEPLPPYATAVAAPPPVPVAAPSPSPAPPRAGMAVTAEPLPPPRAVTAAR